MTLEIKTTTLNENSSRKMATVRRIDKIEPIEGADKIVKATVGGWQLVTAIDNGFKEGDLVVYCEIDSWIPTEVAPFLSKGKEPHEYLGVKGEKLRSIKLRGTVSQGLLLPLSVLDHVDSELFEGLDVSYPLGIVKYEPPIPAQLAGLVKGNFPSQIPKTDQERIQNLKREFDGEFRTKRWEVTEKLEGSSMTVYVINGEFGVCSRNLDLKRDENNTFWKVAIEEKLEEKLKTLAIDIAVQGELIGPGIQDNIYKLSKHEFRVFDVYDIPNGKYYTPMQRAKIVDDLALLHTPTIAFQLSFEEDDTMETALQYADGHSVLGVCPLREGLVFKSTDGTKSFKIISNKYLLGQKE